MGDAQTYAANSAFGGATGKVVVVDSLAENQFVVGCLGSASSMSFSSDIVCNLCWITPGDNGVFTAFVFLSSCSS